MPEEINHDRRRFLRNAAMGFAATELAMIGFADAQSSNSAATTATKPGTHTSFASLKQINAGVLTIGYAEAGPADGPAVVLLHGWPYDIHSYVDVAPLLASASYAKAELGWWYQYYFSTERGRLGYGENRNDFNKPHLEDRLAEVGLR